MINALKSPARVWQERIDNLASPFQKKKDTNIIIEIIDGRQEIISEIKYKHKKVPKKGRQDRSTQRALHKKNMDVLTVLSKNMSKEIQDIENYKPKELNVSTIQDMSLYTSQIKDEKDSTQKTIYKII